MARLNPSEVLFGMDWGGGADSSPIHADMFKQSRVIRVKKSGWNMQLAKVMWDCILESSNDIICVINIDELVNPILMEGAGVVGVDGVALHSAQARPCIKTFRDKIRHMGYEKHISTAPEPFENFTGVFWLYRPYILKTIDSAKYSKIHNGSDGFIFHHVRKSRYDIVYSRKFSHTMLDYDNNTLPWRQFHDGVWSYTHNWPCPGRILRNVKTRTWFYSIIKKHPYFYRGWIWARDNKGSHAVSIAQKESFYEWAFRGNWMKAEILLSCGREL